jgi:hypothetical protein
VLTSAVTPLARPPERLTVTIAEPPFSVLPYVAAMNWTVPAVSSSRLVIATSGGFNPA